MDFICLDHFQVPTYNYTYCRNVVASIPIHLQTSICNYRTITVVGNKIIIKKVMTKQHSVLIWGKLRVAVICEMTSLTPTDLPKPLGRNFKSGNLHKWRQL